MGLSLAQLQIINAQILADPVLNAIPASALIQSCLVGSRVLEHFGAVGGDTPEIIVTGTFDAPEWEFVGTVLNQNFDDNDLDLTLAETITFVGVTGINGDFVIDNGDQVELTAIDIASVASISGAFEARVLSALVSLDASGLTTVGGDSKISQTALVDPPDLSALVAVGSDFAMNSNESLESSPDLSALTTVGGEFQFEGNLVVETPPDLSSLQSVGNNLVLIDNPAMTTAPNLSALVSVGAGGEGGMGFNGNTVMTTMPNLSSLLELGGGFNASGCALTEAAVNAILVKLASLNGTGGTTSYDNQEVDLSGGTNAPPGAAGLTAKAALELRGNTVTVN